MFGAKGGKGGPGNSVSSTGQGGNGGDAKTSLDVLRREAELGRRLIQVGLMRRFDDEYVQLKAMLDDGQLDAPRVLHCVHPDPAVAAGFDSAMVVRDSRVHEVDVTRFLLGEEIASIQIVTPRPNPGAPTGLRTLRSRSCAHAPAYTWTWNCLSPPVSATRFAPRLLAKTAAQ